MAYADWAKLVGGLMDDTPLGRTVSVRMEKDKDVIKHFTSGQRAMRQEWRAFLAEYGTESAKDGVERLKALERELARMFG